MQYEKNVGIQRNKNEGPLQHFRIGRKVKKSRITKQSPISQMSILPIVGKIRIIKYNMYSELH